MFALLLLLMTSVLPLLELLLPLLLLHINIIISLCDDCRPSPPPSLLFFSSSFFLVEDGLLFFRLANAGRHSNVHEETIDPSITTHTFIPH